LQDTVSDLVEKTNVLMKLVKILNHG